MYDHTERRVNLCCKLKVSKMENTNLVLLSPCFVKYFVMVNIEFYFYFNTFFNLLNDKHEIVKIPSTRCLAFVYIPLSLFTPLHTSHRLCLHLCIYLIVFVYTFV